MTGRRLRPVPSRLTTWKRWKRLHPGTLVLSRETGYARDYGTDPYADYHKSLFPFFFMRRTPPELPSKEVVLGVSVGGEHKAYPFSLLREAEGPIKDSLGGREIAVHFDRGSEEAYATDPEGRRLPSFVSYWFVWYDFHRDTKVFKDGKR